MLGFSKNKTDSQKQKGESAGCRVMSDLLSEDNADRHEGAVQSWRVFRIMAEFVEGFEMLRRYGTAATIFGSARAKEGDPHYDAARELASLLAQSDITIISGGGHGVMEAANRGAHEAGGTSIGFNIQLPHEQKLNEYTTESRTFDYFFSRKVMLAFASEVYIYFPGGFGTLDELFEMLTLVQTRKITPVPIVLYGAAFWEPLVSFIEDTLRAQGMVDTGDARLFTVVDSVDEAYAHIIKHIDLAAPRQV